MTHEAAATPALADDRLIGRLVELVIELDLDRRDFVVFGSGPLLAHGLRDHIRDVDVVARGATWRRVRRHGVLTSGTINGAPMAIFASGLIQFSAGWISEDWDPDDLIDRAEIIQELPFARLTDVLAYKRQLNRAKDRTDIVALLDLPDLHDMPDRAESSPPPGSSDVSRRADLGATRVLSPRKTHVDLRGIRRPSRPVAHELSEVDSRAVWPARRTRVHVA